MTLTNKQNGSCGKCPTYEMGKDELQGLRRHGERQRERVRQRHNYRQ